MRTIRNRTVLFCFRWSAFAAVAGSSACGSSDAPTRPPTGASLDVRIDGSGQRGFVGQPLDNPIVVHVVDSAGRTVAGKRRIRIAVADGGGAVSDTALLSDDNGGAAVSWSLGKVVGTQQLAVTLPDAPSSREERALAHAVPLDAADVVAVSGATSGTIGILVREDDGVVPYTLTWPDTLLRLLPRSAEGTWEEVTAFAVGHPPVSVLRPWTDNVDTVRLAFRAPIAVPFTIWIAYDFDTTAARARFDFAALDAFWRAHMTGLQVGKTRVESAPGLLFLCGGDTRGYYDAAAINVYYMDYVTPSEDCNAHIIRIHGNTPASFDPVYSLILAHEVGHAMSLIHVDDPANVMEPVSPPGSVLTTGQIYWMHFDAAGALNSVVGVHPAAERNCQLPFSSHCPDQKFARW